MADTFREKLYLPPWLKLYLRQRWCQIIHQIALVSWPKKGKEKKEKEGKETKKLAPMSCMCCGSIM